MQKELRLELPEHALEITVRGVRWDGQEFALDAITGTNRRTIAIYTNGQSPPLLAQQRAQMLQVRTIRLPPLP